MLEKSIFEKLVVVDDHPDQDGLDDASSQYVEWLAIQDAERAKEANFTHDSIFTPLYWAVKDAVPRMNWETLIVLGRMLGYCQMKNGECYASTATLAEQCRISVRSVKYAIQVLEAQDLMDDLTPNRHRRTHVYVPTDKLRKILKKSGVRMTIDE